MRINKELVLQPNGFLPARRNQTYLIRMLFNEVDKAKACTLNIAFKDFKNWFKFDVRQNYINELLNNIANTTFTYNGKEYKYIDSFIADLANKSFVITFPPETVAIWFDNAIVYDIDYLNKIGSIKHGIVIYEYLKAGAKSLSAEKFFDIFSQDSYSLFDKKRQLCKTIDVINDSTDLSVEVDFDRKQCLFTFKEKVVL